MGGGSGGSVGLGVGASNVNQCVIHISIYILQAILSSFGLLFCQMLKVKSILHNIDWKMPASKTVECQSIKFLQVDGMLNPNN